MASYHQMGHDSRNLLSEPNLKSYKGAILSPTNYTESEIIEQIKSLGSENFKMIFDPQLYYPKSERGCLSDWSYFPSDVDTADQSSISWWEKLISNIASSVQTLNPQAVCSPAVVPNTFSDDYYELHRDVADLLRKKIVPEVDLFHTVIAQINDLAVKDRAGEIASIVSSGTAGQVYLVLLSDIEPRREFQDTESIKGAMRLIRYLEDSDIRVLVGFVSSDLVLWKFAGATSCATGKFFNLRRFTPARWGPASEGGGQVSYWFEQSLMAFLREADLIRIRRAELLSNASISNPYSQEILNQIDTTPDIAWLGLGWRQYLYWFSNFESQFIDPSFSVRGLLKDAEDIWRQLEDRDILMDELRNDGGWIRSWRRSIAEAFS